MNLKDYFYKNSGFHTETYKEIFSEEAFELSCIFAINFAKWLDTNYFKYNDFEKTKSIEELLNIFIKETTKKE